MSFTSFTLGLLAFGTPGFPEIVIMVFVVLGVVAIARFVSRTSCRPSQKNFQNTSDNHSQRRSKSPWSAPRPPIRRPRRAGFVGCFLTLVGIGAVGLFLVVLVVGGLLFSYRGAAHYDHAKNHAARTLDVTIDKNASSTASTTNESKTHFKAESKMNVAFNALPIMFLVLLLGIGVLVAIVSVAIARRTPRKYRPDDDYPYDPDSDSMAYRSSYRRPSAQKTGALPWIVVGMAITVGLAAVLLPLLWVRSGVPVPEEQIAQVRQNTAGSGISDEQVPGLIKNLDEINDTWASTHRPSKNEIDVPVEEPETTSDEEPKPINRNEPSIDELDAELDRSGASLLLSSLFDAAVRSFKESKNQDGSPSNDAVAETSKTEKPGNALKSLTSALGAELPAGIDEKTALKSLGRFLGKAIAAESTPRPAWIDEPSGVTPDSGEYRTVVMIGPCLGRRECELQKIASLQERVKEYAEVELGLGPIVRNQPTLSPDQIRDMIKREYLQLDNTSSAGTIVYLHVELAFDSQTRDLLRAKFHESIIQDRIRWSGVALGCMTFFLLCSLAVLKIDPLYRRRVAITVGVGVVVLLGVGILVIA